MQIQIASVGQNESFSSFEALVLAFAVTSVT